LDNVNRGKIAGEIYRLGMKSFYEKNKKTNNNNNPVGLSIFSKFQKTTMESAAQYLIGIYILSSAVSNLRCESRDVQQCENIKNFYSQ